MKTPELDLQGGAAHHALHCFFCGAPARVGEQPGNSLCEDHQVIREHTVSMQRAGGCRVAKCRCGWDFAVASSGLRPVGAEWVRDQAVHEHWCFVIEGAAE